MAGFGYLRIIQNDLIANYDAVSVILRQRMWHGLQLTGHYTKSRTRDIADNGNISQDTMMNPFDIWADYGPSDWDVPHRFVAPISTTCRSERRRAADCQVCPLWLAGERHYDAAKRPAHERDDSR